MESLSQGSKMRGSGPRQTLFPCFPMWMLSYCGGDIKIRVDSSMSVLLKVCLPFPNTAFEKSGLMGRNEKACSVELCRTDEKRHVLWHFSETDRIAISIDTK